MTSSSSSLEMHDTVGRRWGGRLGEGGILGIVITRHAKLCSWQGARPGQVGSWGLEGAQREEVTEKIVVDRFLRFFL